MRAISLLAVLAPALASCATTSGQDWLNSPLDEQATSTSERLARESAAPATVPGLQDPSSSNARPRLQHTITLGEDYGIASAAPAGAAPGGPSIQVNVNVPVAVNNYGGYGYGLGYYGYANGSPARSGGPAPTPHVQPGQDFPSPPSYGPAFPYRTAPASPWAR